MPEVCEGLVVGPARVVAHDEGVGIASLMDRQRDRAVGGVGQGALALHHDQVRAPLVNLEDHGLHLTRHEVPQHGIDGCPRVATYEHTALSSGDEGCVQAPVAGLPYHLHGHRHLPCRAVRARHKDNGGALVGHVAVEQSLARRWSTEVRYRGAAPLRCSIHDRVVSQEVMEPGDHVHTHFEGDQ